MRTPPWQGWDFDEQPAASMIDAAKRPIAEEKIDRTIDSFNTRQSAGATSQRRGSAVNPSMLSECSTNARGFPKPFREDKIYMKEKRIGNPRVNVPVCLAELSPGLGGLFRESA
jgi:hypothetical protein